jgi:uncharacterized damage-inducible protein DinB
MPCNRRVSHIFMAMRLIYRPDKGDYPAYAEIYMKLLPDDGLVLQHLRNNFQIIKELIYSLPEAKLLHRYEAGKWSIKETLVHIIDDERIYAYRALRFARHEKLPLTGFDQDAYARYSAADQRDLDNIFEEYAAVRQSTIAFFNGLPEESLDRRGSWTTATGDATVSALACHIAGHELHHLNLIKERYL